MEGKRTEEVAYGSRTASKALPRPATAAKTARTETFMFRGMWFVANTGGE